MTKPFAERIRDDWGSDAVAVYVLVDAERAALAGISHDDIATSSAGSNGGQVIGALRDKDTSCALEMGGEEEQVKGFGNLFVVLVLSSLVIFVALTLQFKSAVNPVIVFATIPLGVVGAWVSLQLTHSPFGFMAFLGIISLIGVIVSHVIVLFEFIEERQEHGDLFEDALVSAGSLRFRPVPITVIVTVIASFPLAVNGVPLWAPLWALKLVGFRLRRSLR